MTPKQEFLKDGKWTCNKCGACCRFVWLVLPELDRGDGTCQHLLADNTCGIYEIRPEQCRVNTQHFSDEILAEACAYVNDIVV